jgi:AraC-like DNA-binding protein
MSRKKLEWWDLPVPTVIPLTYLRLAEEHGVSARTMLERAGLPTDLVSQPRELRLIQMQELLNAMIELLGDNGLGVDIGWRLPPTAFGNVGYALLCSEKLGDALRICQRYWHLIARGTTLQVRREGSTHIAEVAPVAPMPDVHHRMIMETTFSSVCRGFQLLAPDTLQRLEAWFDYPAPAYAAKVRATLQNVRFDMPSCQLRFPAEILDITLGLYNPTGLKFALEQCEREYALAELDTHETLARVRSRIVFTGHGYPSLEQVSKQMNMTTRTLRRRLEEEGTTYKALVEQAKRRDAIRLLDDISLPVQRIAELLGYHDPANFTRAFRQWTDQTPSDYRRTRQPGV